MTTQQFLTDAFNATAGARASQDVGLDGLVDTDEQAFFNPSVTPGPFSTLTDPSGDDFLHHLDPNVPWSAYSRPSGRQSASWFAIGRSSNWHC